MRALAALVVLAACDGAGKDPAGDDTDPGSAPTVAILDPNAGERLATPAAVRLWGEGSDAEDGPLPDDALRWRSSVDGDLGAGATLTVALSVGPHTLTLTGTDSDGNTASAEVAVEVAEANLPPLPAIVAPLPGAVVREGQALRLEGLASDPEDGDLEGEALGWSSSRDGAWGTGAVVTVPAPSLGEHIVVLTAVDSAGLQATASVIVRVAAVGENVAPWPTIAEPAAGASFLTTDTITLRGSAVDDEDGPVTGGDLAWSSSLTGPLGTGATVVLDGLAPGAHTIRLSATDSDGAVGVAEVDVSVASPGNAAPVVQIQAPADGAVFNAGAEIELVGGADDPEDGALSGAALAWTSSLDGALGTGSPLRVTTLSEGTHTLRLTATDRGGASGVASRVVSVLAANEAPTVEITGPADGSRFVAGATVQLEALASDPEDGPISASVTWASTLDGPLGAGSPRATSALTPGVHTITATVRDSGGLVGVDQIAVTIDPPPVPLAPVASLTGSPDALVGVPWTADGSASVDPDGAVVRWAFDWGDGSPVTAGTGSTADHTWAAPGAFTVTLTVTDDDGLTDVTTLPVSVTVPVRAPVLVDGRGGLGDFCDIAVDAQDRPRVLYGDTRHGQVWYAAWDGAAWTRELVEGPGFDVGGLMAGSGALAVDGATVHAAWSLDDAVRYGQRTAAGWTIETVGADPGEPLVALALDPANNRRPTVVWTNASARVAVSYRTGAAAWTQANWNRGSFRGGAAFQANGTLVFTVGGADLATSDWSANGFGFWSVIDSGADVAVAPVDVSGPETLVLWDEGLSRRLGNAWEVEVIANSPLTTVDLDWDPVAGEPVAALRNDQGQVEIVRPGAGAYWTWAYQGPMDDGGLAMVVDGQGEVRACFFRDGNLVVY